MADQNIKIAISAIDETKAAFNSINKSLGTLRTSFQALNVIAAATVFAGFIKAQIDAQDEIFKMSQKIGIATDELSKLQYAAKLADVDTAQLQTGLVKLSKGMGEAARGTGEAYNAFSAMGISVKNTDGTLKSNSQLLGEVADKFAGYEDGASKTALAVAIFGRSGADLIPLLNAGREGLKDAGDELGRFGGVVMPEAAKQAEIFNDNITKLSTVVGGAGKAITNELLTPINRVIGLLFAINKVAAEKGMSFWDFLKPPTKESAAAFLEVEKLYQKYQGITEETSKAVTKAPILVDQKKFDAGREALKKLIDTTQQNLDKQTRQAQVAMATATMTDEQKAAVERLVQIYDTQIEKEAEINRMLEEGKITKADAAQGLKDIAEASDEARAAAEELLVKQEQLNGSWEYGANVALRNYANEAANVNKAAQNVVSNGLKSMEDALVGVMMRTTSVADAFRSMANSIITDMARIMMRQMITAPLAQALSSSIMGSFATSNVNLGSSALGSNPSASTGFGIKLATGTNEVPYDNFPALLHKGEAVVPAKYNPAVGGESSQATVVNQTINISTGVAQTVRTEVQSMMPRIMEATKAAVADAKRRGGTYGKMMA